MGCQLSSSNATVEEVQTPLYEPQLDKPCSTESTPCELNADPIFTVTLEKKPGDKLGIGLGSTRAGAAIFSIKAGGLLDKHNQGVEEESQVFPGCIVLEVNGKMGYWAIFEEITKLGTFVITVTNQAPAGVSDSWFQEIADLGKEMEARGSPFMLRLRPDHPDGTTASYSSLPTVRAGDVKVDQCAICLADVGEDAKLMQLPCGHCFHLHCAGRWLTEGARNAPGKRQCCPLCCRRVTDDAKPQVVNEAGNTPSMRRRATEERGGTAA